MQGDYLYDEVKIAAELAADWLTESGSEHSEGWIFVWNRVVQGWSFPTPHRPFPMPDACDWRPDTFVIDVYGRAFIAVGGNDQDGAKRWELIGARSEL